MPLDDDQNQPDNFTAQSTLGIMADHIKAGNDRVYSCHTQVAYWIRTQENLEPDDEIVLLGQKFEFRAKGQSTEPADTIMHSVIMRDDEVILDPFEHGEYEPDEDKYRFKMSENAPTQEFEVLHRTPLIDFLKDHGIVPPDFKPETSDEPGF